MKKVFGFMVLVMLVCVACVGFNGKSAKAASGIQKLKVNEEAVAFDVDGDGVMEQIGFTQTELKDYPDFFYGTITVDGKEVLSTPQDQFGYWLTASVITCGKNVFVEVYQFGDNDICVFHKLFSIDKNHKAKVAVNFLKTEPAVTSSDIIKVTNKSIKLSSYTQPSQVGAIKFDSVYTVKGNKVTLKSATHKVKSLVKKLKKLIYTTNRKVKFTTKINGKKGFTLKKGVKVKLLNVTLVKNKVYGCYKYGKKKGYLRVDKYLTKGYFKVVYHYLAG